MKAVSSDILIIAAAQGSGTSILIILFVLTVRADAPKYYMGMTNGIAVSLATVSIHSRGT